MVIVNAIIIVMMMSQCDKKSGVPLKMFSMTPDGVMIHV
jgi:hypothetical protein